MYVLGLPLPKLSMSTPPTTPSHVRTDDILKSVAEVQNGRLKVLRLCCEIVDLMNHGIFLPTDMQGLLEEQIAELKLTDDDGDRCVPSGGFDFQKDPIGRRNGKAPIRQMKDVLFKTVEEAKSRVSQQNVSANVCLTLDLILETIDMLKGAVTVVYPMGLPVYDPIRMEFENREDLSGTQGEKEIVDATQATLWFSTKELTRGKKLKEFLGGANEKSKVILKLSNRSSGQPAREPVFTEDDQKRLLQLDYKRREELARLERDQDDSYLNSPWADEKSLKNRMNGLSDIGWRPK